MLKAVIYYTDGSYHKMSCPVGSCTLEEFDANIDSNIKGYPERTLHRVVKWIERP